MRRLLATATLSLGMLFGAQAGQADESLTIGLASPPSLTYGAWYLAQTTYFPEEGLDVEVVNFDGSATVLPQIAGQHILAGALAPDILIASRQPGRDKMPVKLIYNYLRAFPWEFVVRADSPIQSLEDLRGKKIGVISLTTGNVPITKAMFEELGMVAGQDYELIGVGVGASAFHALNSGAVDALNLFDMMHTMLQLTGTEIRWLEVPEKYRALPAHGLMVHEDSIAEKQETLVKLARGLAKATIACDAAPRACVENFWTLFPNKRPTEGSEEENLAKAEAMLKSGLSKYVIYADDPSKPWGEYDVTALQNLIDALYSGGQISSNEIDPESLIDMSLIGQINDFDSAALKQQAQK